MRAILLLLAAATLAGCAAPQVERRASPMSGSTVSSVRGHGAACSAVTCVGLGGQVDSSRQGEVLLTVHVFNEYRAVTGASVRVGGKVVRLVPAQASTSFSGHGAPMRESSRAFLATRDLAERLASSNDSALRVETPGGYLEETLADSGGQSKAVAALRALLDGSRP